jgi:hypothetical protein
LPNIRVGDLVHPPRGAVRDNGAVEIHDHAFAPSNEPSEPHMQTLAVTIKFWDAFAWLVKRQLSRIGAA